MTTKHTPGPWTLKLTENGHPVIEDRVGRKVVEQFCNGGTSEGSEGRDNARLIAAAPDLLAACKTMLSSMRLMDDGAEDVQREAEDMMRAAIAKAEGGK